MALTKTVTKIMPSWDVIGVHLKLEDDAHPITPGTVIVIDEDVTENYTIAEGPTVAIRNAVAKKVQAKINEYKRVKALYLLQQYTDAVSWIDTNTTT